MAPIVRIQFYGVLTAKNDFFSKILFKLHFGPKITSKKGEQASFENMPFFQVVPQPLIGSPDLSEREPINSLSYVRASVRTSVPVLQP